MNWNKYIDNDQLAKFDKPVDEWTDLEIRDWQIDNYNNQEGTHDGSYKCVKCKDKGDIAVPIDDDKTSYPQWGLMDCECKKKQVAANRLVNSSLGKIIKSLNMNSFKTKYDWQVKIKQKAVEYGKNPKGWFYVGGAIGRGKSHLCFATVQSLIYNGKQVEYMMWQSDVNEIKAMEMHMKQEALKLLKHAEVLYIDDLFKKSQTDADIKIAYEILNHRYNMDKPTIISSEYTLEQLETIDEAIASRIGERSRKHNIKLSKDTTKNIRKEWR